MISLDEIVKLCKLKSKKICNALTLSNYILNIANYEISNFELNQILWFIEVEHIKKFNEPLIIENFETLSEYKNILIKEIYDEFRDYGANSIDDFTLSTYIDLYSEQIQLIDEVVRNYKNLSYFKSCAIIREMLNDMNHNIGVISKASMIEHFRNND